MIRYSGIFLSLLMLSGCATEALKNEQAETVITAGNKAVAANASFFKQYYASRENFLVNFYATNPDCALRPDYETIMENNTKEVAIKWSAAPDMTPQTVLYRRPVAQFSNFQPKIV
ncbi:hypothetical protein QS801_24465, partial [Escherichia coli]|nr:hypothetical protein [Escherichia coli]